MPRLDDRLKAVARQIRCGTHADIGSDHGHLLVALLKSGRIRRGIAIENKPQPLENSSRSLRGLNAEVRFADGFAGLSVGEVDSASLCGLGGETIVRILDAFPDRVPDRVVLQPNRRPEWVRRWAIRSGFHLMDEQIARGHWDYPVLSFQRLGSITDPAYGGLDHEAALLFGPLLMKRMPRLVHDRLAEERLYLRKLQRLGPESAARLRVIERVLSAAPAAERS
ncbi:SAM-dependent methyltransferase [Roseiconus nitratireducens]|uniref:SAM-dependent methyltransferase n=1 Tax=Roseiconus nitratireducens TaxID=2605748 RepID=A0A5M6CUY2_9BACT|nr:class I SAM-dependent methyltransferase [Roseiconus nitratireducens]KAA5539058.1 SAM-dependent methyltransferase [Roseiconus nitratireducens]